jgi:hypothetical protein
VTEEPENARKTAPPAGVDDIVCSAKKLVQHSRRGLRRLILPHDGEIICHLAIQQR